MRELIQKSGIVIVLYIIYRFILSDRGHIKVFGFSIGWRK